MNHYPKHLGDWLKRTVGLSMLREGAYSRLVDAYYTEERALPLDRDDLYDATRCRDKAEREAVDYCLRKFFVETAKGWRHDRCEEELAAYRERSRKAAKSANERWARSAPAPGEALPTDTPSNADAMRSHPPSIGSHEPEPTPTLASASSGEKKRERPKPAAVPVPEWIPAQAWADFLDFRKRKGSPMTARAQELAIMKLDAMRQGGQDPAAVLDQSTMNGWTSLRPVELRSAVGPRASLTQAGQRTAEAAERWLGRTGTDDREGGQ